MPGLTPKTEVLQHAGYVFHFDREIYFNQRLKTAFSVEWIEDHSLADLKEKILQPNSGTNWRFYFNSAPSPAVRRALERELR